MFKMMSAVSDLKKLPAAEKAWLKRTVLEFAEVKRAELVGRGHEDQDARQHIRTVDTALALVNALDV